MFSSYLVKCFFIRYWKFPRNSGIVKAPVFMCLLGLQQSRAKGRWLLRDPSMWQTSTRNGSYPLPILTTLILSENIAVSLWLLTWKTVTRAQNRSSKFARAAVFTPSSSGNIYLPPKRFIPRILAVNMKSINRARNVITLSIVWIITSNCRLSAGRKRTNLNMRSKRNDRNTEILLSPPPNSSTMLQKFEEDECQSTHFIDLKPV